MSTNGQLAVGNPESPPARTAPIILEGLDKTHAETVKEIDALIRELNQLKEHLNANHQGVKDQIAIHFALGAEAMSFANLVRERLIEIGRGSAMGERKE